MTSRSQERIIVDKVREYFTTKFEDQLRILGVRIRPWQMTCVKENADIRVAHPDIDILWTRPDKRELMAVEVKTIHLSGNTPSLRYYQGIDEALALLRFGVDSSSLFQVFIFDVETEEVSMIDTEELARHLMPYQAAVVELIRESKIPIGYRAAIDVRIGGVISEKPLQVISVSGSDQKLIAVEPVRNPLLKSRGAPIAIRWCLARRFL